MSLPLVTANQTKVQQRTRERDEEGGPEMAADPQARSIGTGDGDKADLAVLSLSDLRALVRTGCLVGPGAFNSGEEAKTLIKVCLKLCNEVRSVEGIWHLRRLLIPREGTRIIPVKALRLTPTEVHQSIQTVVWPERLKHLEFRDPFNQPMVVLACQTACKSCHLGGASTSQWLGLTCQIA
ncbi:unnamed protein product [Chrysoparadoxa australica]